MKSRRDTAFETARYAAFVLERAATSRTPQDPNLAALERIIAALPPEKLAALIEIPEVKARLAKEATASWLAKVLAER
jgi:hypothetical protein